MVKSRNEAILDLTAPLIEKYVYKVPSSREAWGSHLSFRVIILPKILKRFLGEHFLEGKERTDPGVIYKLGQPYLRRSKLLACWNHLGGIRIETRNGSASWLGGMW